MRKALSVFSVFMVLAWSVVDVGNVAAWDLGECLENAVGGEEGACYAKDKRLEKLRSAAAKKGDGKISYLAYNVWLTRRADNQKCINYKDGPILPAGTEIRAAITIDDTVIFMAKEMKDEVTVKFTEEWHPGKSPVDYLNMMITEKPLTELTAGMSEIELQGIRDGLIYEGMSKDAVVIAYGYPPEHYTPSLDEDRWMYWKNKFKRHRICFDENDRTIPCEAQRAKKVGLTGKPL